MSAAEEWKRFERYIDRETKRTRRLLDRQQPWTREQAFWNGYHNAFCAFYFMVQRRAKRVAAHNPKTAKKRRKGSDGK